MQETTEIIQFLLEHDAHSNIKNMAGWTPLYYACDSLISQDYATKDGYEEERSLKLGINTEIIKLLITYNANPFIQVMQDNEEITPVYIVYENSFLSEDERMGIIACLLKKEKREVSQLFLSCDDNINEFINSLSAQ